MNFFRNSKEFLKSIPNKKGMVFTNGCFDILHVGHVRYLNESKKLGKYLVVGLNSNNSVKKLKGNSRPINDENDRAEVLLALNSVDYVILFEEDTPFKLIKAIKPDVLTKGGDYNKQNIVGADIVESNGGKVIVIPFEAGYSTTTLIDKIYSK